MKNSTIHLQRPRLPLVALLCSLFGLVPFFPLLGAVLGVVALIRLRHRSWYAGHFLAAVALPLSLAAILALQPRMIHAAIYCGCTTVEATEVFARIVGAMQRRLKQGKHPIIPQGTTGWTPARNCCRNGQRKCPARPEIWETPLWQSLGFKLSEPHYFQFRYTSRANRFVLEARTDFYCDGRFSYYKQRGSLKARKLTVSNELE